MRLIEYGEVIQPANSGGDQTGAAGSNKIGVAGCHRIRRRTLRYLYYSLYSQGLNSSAVLCSMSEVFLVATAQL